MNASRGSGTDVAVVGGGIAGLTAAALIARAGRRVTVFEKSQTIGGRAVTHEVGEFRFNLGPHALYERGDALKILTGLGLQLSGGQPSASGGYAVERGVKHALPGGFLSLLTTGLLRLPEKLEVARLLGSIHRIDAAAAQGESVADWLQRSIRHPSVRALVQALFRLSTYSNDPERQSAGSAIVQLQLALAGNVRYVDGGWQTMVDGVQAVARAAGATIASGMRATAIEIHGTASGVRLADGALYPAEAVIVAAGPLEACSLVAAADDTPLARWAAAAVPVRAACLDIGLTHLPQPRARFALGIDRPLYLSVHSAVAKLAPGGRAMIHVAKYLPSGSASDAKADERELETLLDQVQPGWRAAVGERRFLPSMIVSNALVTAAGAGLAGRPGPAVPWLRNVYLAGDWIGPSGQLADAAVASAQQGAELVLRAAPATAAAA